MRHYHIANNKSSNNYMHIRFSGLYNARRTFRFRFYPVYKRFVCDDVYDKHKSGKDFRDVASVSRRILAVSSLECAGSTEFFSEFPYTFSTVRKSCQELRIRDMAWADPRCRSFNRNSQLDTKQGDLFYCYCDNAAAHFSVTIEDSEKISKYRIFYLLYYLI